MFLFILFRANLSSSIPFPFPSISRPMGNIRNFFRVLHLYHRRRHRETLKSQSSEAPQSDQKRTPLEDLERVFARFDTNGDGKISASELSSIFETLGEGLTADELRSMMAEVDSDGDGFISLEEFVDLNTRGVQPDDTLEDIRNAFAVFDLDHNGSISADELMRVLKNLGEGATVAQCRKMISGVDKDGDGMIDFEEFKAMMMYGDGFMVSSSRHRSSSSLERIQE